MTLAINKNINAANAYYYVQRNDNLLMRSLERLSTGLRINRSADDPAGLSLSQKYQAQAEGLHTAVRNAESGVDLIQTAEGALTEVSTILRSMRRLALHSASTATSDAESVRADQNQLLEQIERLNEIAGNTQYGQAKLLDGSAGVIGTVTGINASSFDFVSAGDDVAEGTYTLRIDNVATRAVIQSRNPVQIQNWSADESGHPVSGAANGDTITFNIDGRNFTFIKGVSTNTSAGVFANLEGLANCVNSSAMADYMTAQTAGSIINLESGISDTIAISVNSYVAGSLGVALGMAGDEVSIGSGAVSSSRFTTDQTLTFTEGYRRAVTTIKAGTSINQALLQIQRAIDSARIGLVIDYNGLSPDRFTLKNRSYGDSTAVSTSLMSSEAGSGYNMNLIATAGVFRNIASGNGDMSTLTAGNNVDGRINGISALGYALTMTGIDGLIVDTIAEQAENGDTATITVNRNSLVFQIGAYSYQLVEFTLPNISAENLGRSNGTDTPSVNAIDITSPEKAQEAIRVIDKAIDEVNAIRSRVGSVQKDMLETAIRNLTVAFQNISATESSIRNADMAQELVNFSKASILKETSLAFFVQASVAPWALVSMLDSVDMSMPTGDTPDSLQGSAGSNFSYTPSADSAGFDYAGDTGAGSFYSSDFFDLSADSSDSFLSVAV